MSFGKYNVTISGLNLKSEKAQKKSFSLTPVPQIISLTSGLIDFSTPFHISTNLSEEYYFIFDQFIEYLTNLLRKNPKYSLDESEEFDELFDFEEEIINLTGNHMSNFMEQGYILLIESTSQEINIWADNPVGIFYAFQTIYQLLNNYNEGFGYLPGIKILDYPDMKMRGISDDVSRGQMATKQGVKKFITELSRFKQNYYFLYVEDVIKFVKHPKIGINRGAFDKDDIKELSDFAKQYFMEFTLVFESLGHMDNILSLPEYQNLAEFPSSDCINVADPKIYDFFNDIFRELYGIFDSKVIHLGCDESWELGSFRSKKFVKDKGKSKVYLDHYTEIYEIAKEAGFEEIYLYHDIAHKFPEVLNNLPRDYKMVVWRYSNKKSFPQLDKIIDSGLECVVSPAVQDWSRFFPDMAAMEGNTENFIRYGCKKGAYGVIQSSWGDFRNENLRDNRLYGFALSACAAWNINKFEIDSFWDSFLQHFYGNSMNFGDTQRDNIKKVLNFFKKIKRDKLLNNKQNFPHFWAHPYAYPGKKWPCKGYGTFLPQIEEIISISSDLINQVPRNKLNIEMLYYAARIYRFFAKKLLNSESVKNEFNEKNQILKEIEWLKSEILDLRTLFENLWNTTCSDANLKPLLDQFNWLNTFYEEKLELLNGELIENSPNIPSCWIYSPQRPAKNQAFDSYFKKVIEIPENFEAFKVQVIGDTHIKVYYNGNLLEEFFSKRTLSVRMLNNMVKLINLTDKSTSGKNSLVVENINYQGGCGFVNVYGEIKLKSGEIIPIYSDDSWNVRNEFDKDWISDTSSESKNKRPKSAGKPPFLNGAISIPNFELNICSHHTSHLCLGSQSARYIPRVLRFLMGFLAKRMYKNGVIL